MFIKREGKLWTWTSPNLDFKAELDYIISSRKARYITDCEAKNFSFHSDHRLVVL